MNNHVKEEKLIEKLFHNLSSLLSVGNMPIKYRASKYTNKHIYTGMIKTSFTEFLQNVEDIVEKHRKKLQKKNMLYTYSLDIKMEKQPFDDKELFGEIIFEDGKIRILVYHNEQIYYPNKHNIADSWVIVGYISIERKKLFLL